MTLRVSVIAAVLLGAGQLAVVASMAATPAAAAPPAGNWRMTVDLGGGVTLTYLLSFETKDGSWRGSFLGWTDPGKVAASVNDVNLTGDRLRFRLALDGQEYAFDGKVAADGGRIPGALVSGDALVLTALAPSKLPAFDRTALLKEILAVETGPALYNAAVDLLGEAAAVKASQDEVRSWIDKAMAAARGHGVRWQLVVAMRLLRALAEQREYTAPALALAQTAERLLEANDDPALQLPVLEALQTLLWQSNQPAEGNALSGRIAELEERDERDESARSPVQPQAFAGRKSPSDRAVLVELFTGAECPPCPAADLAASALIKAYKPSEVVCLQYHLHMPGPDPMTNPVSQARQRYYKASGTPTVFFDGKAAAGGGGGPEAAPRRYADYQKIIEPLLDTPAGGKLQLQVSRSGERIAARVKVSELAKPGPKVKLRAMLVEDFVRYRGGNGVRVHHAVVRAALGPDDGVPLEAANSEHEFLIDLGTVRQALTAHLDQFQKENDFLFVDRPLKLSRLRVAAFVQDDGAQEVRQAVQAPVK